MISHKKPGATVIDVGINRIFRDGKSSTGGDVTNTQVRLTSPGAITPVPGGARTDDDQLALLANTLVACCRAYGPNEPEGLTA